VRLTWSQITFRNLVRRQFHVIKSEFNRFRASDPARLSDHAIWAGLRTWQAKAVQVMQLVFALGGQFGYQALLEMLCKRLGVPPERVMNSILVVGPKSVSTRQAFELIRLAQMARRDERIRSFLLNEEKGFEQFGIFVSGTEFSREFDAFLRNY